MTNVIQRIILVVAGIVACQLIISQENYVPGYVLKSNSDTLFGFINDRNWVRNPSKIMFKQNIENSPITFTPIDIIEFGIGNDVYESGIVEVEVTPLQLDNLKEDPQPKIEIDTAFLQTLIKGKKSLYYYKNSQDRENFYVKQDSGFSLLIYKIYVKEQDYKPSATENRRYLNQLTLYLMDCDNINLKLQNTSYSKRDLLDLFRYYYKCSPSQINFQMEKTRRVRLEYGLLAGASKTSIYFEGLGLNYLVNPQYNSSVNPSAGVFLDVILPWYVGKWSVNNEVLFSSYNVKATFEEFENENDFSVTNTNIGYSYLKVNNLIRFNYPFGKMFLFINAGVSNGFAIMGTNYKKTETTLYNTKRVVEGLALESTRNHELSIVLGAGIKYNRFSFEARYERGDGISDYSYLSTPTRRYYLLLGFRF